MNIQVRLKCAHLCSKFSSFSLSPAKWNHCGFEYRWLYFLLLRIWGMCGKTTVRVGKCEWKKCPMLVDWVIQGRAEHVGTGCRDAGAGTRPRPWRRPSGSGSAGNLSTVPASENARHHQRRELASMSARFYAWTFWCDLRPFVRTCVEVSE